MVIVMDPTKTCERVTVIVAMFWAQTAICPGRSTSRVASRFSGGFRGVSMRGTIPKLISPNQQMPQNQPAHYDTTSQWQQSAQAIAASF
jgi:hypothetical protein